MVAFCLLALLQFIVSRGAIYSDKFREKVHFKPTILYHEDNFLGDIIREQGLTKEEIEAKVRKEGYGSFQSIYAVVMEADGDMSVIPKDTGEELIKKISN